MDTPPPSGTASGIDSTECHRLVVANKLSELRHMSEWVHSFARDRGLARELIHALELSLNEALTNIISYGYRDATPHEIVVELFAQPDRICAEIQDDGVPFNPLGLPVEEPPESLEKSRATGRGIPLMRNFMDELHYERRNNRNALTMIMRT